MFVPEKNVVFSEDEGPKVITKAPESAFGRQDTLSHKVTDKSISLSPSRESTWVPVVNLKPLFEVGG